MFKKLLILAVSVGGLVACTPDEPATKTQPAGIVYAVKPGFDQTRVLGTELVSFATSTPRKKGIVSWEEALPGSTCTAESAEIVVNFITPAQVRLPVVKGQPSPMTISCQNGALSGAIRKQPILIESNESGNLALEQDNIVAGVIFGAIAAGKERREARARDAWRYVEVSAGVSLQ